VRAGVFGSARVAGGGGGTTGGYVSTNVSTSNTTTYTFTSQAIGTAASDRRVVVGIMNRDALAVPASVTVDGVGLTMDASKQNTGAASIWSAPIPSGSTGTIVVTYSVANTCCGIGVWETNGDPVATGVSGVNSATPAVTVSTSPGDFVIGVLQCRVSVLGPSVTWNTASERYDGQVDGAVRQHAGADLVAVGSSADMGATITNYSAESALCAVAYR